MASSGRTARAPAASVAEGAARMFEQSCPGCRVDAVRPSGSRRHPTMGSYFGVWEAWASDETVRYRGSSGGALTALHGWLLESGRASRIASASVDSEPRRTVPVTITTKEAALAAAGSRYAPVGVLSNHDVWSSDAITAKPCEISAIRALGTSARSSGAASDAILLSFFCAGTPSQAATDDLLARLGVPADEPIDELWYRGRGWPGRFTVRTTKAEGSLSYDESWGGVLGPATHWRCKVCADGVGESADVVAADFWRVDERGYPVFTEGPGSSALIARTERGLEAVRDAVAAGAIVLRSDPHVRARERATAPAEPSHLALRASARKPARRRRRTPLSGIPTVGAGARASPPEPARGARNPRHGFGDRHSTTGSAP